MNHRKLNFLFIFISIALFVLEASIDERYHLLVAFIAAFIIAFVSFFLKLLTQDGARAAVLLGLIAYGFGGLESAVILVSLFTSSNIVSYIFSKRMHLESGNNNSRRNGSQVWSNGFWFAFFICLWYFLKADMLIIAAFGAIATACSDTWATEAGVPKSGKTILITSGEIVSPGTDGGISLAGTIAALLGALFIGSLTLFFDKNFEIIAVLSIALGGFIGAMADSWLGAYFQFKNRRLPNILDSTVNSDNNSVNFLATGIGSVVTILIYNILIYGMV